MPARNASLPSLTAAVGLASTLCAAFNRRGAVGIGTSSCSGCAALISAATTLHSRRRIEASPDVSCVRRWREAIIRAVARKTHTPSGRWCSPGGAITTHPLPPPLDLEAWRTPGGTHATRRAGMIQAPSSVRKCEMPVSTRMNCPPAWACHVASSGLAPSNRFVSRWGGIPARAAARGFPTLAEFEAEEST